MIVAGGMTAAGFRNACRRAWQSETASSRLNLSQAFNSFGTFIGPALGGFFILSAT